MISPTRAELLANIIDYVELATSLDRAKIIRGNQNAPSPVDTYCTVLYVTDIPDGTANINITDHATDDTKMDYSMRCRRNYNYSIQFYRDNATDHAKSLLMFNETPIGKEFQQTSLFTIKKIESVAQTSEVMSDNFEERAIINIELIVSESQNIEINKVASIDIVINMSDTTDIVENLEIVK